jgi:hypothetical protein
MTRSDNRRTNSDNPALQEGKNNMAHKKKHGGPVPPGNQPQAGVPGKAETSQQTDANAPGGAPLQDQDAKRRLGNFEGTGEHAYQQPGGKNDANR